MKIPNVALVLTVELRIVFGVFEIKQAQDGPCAAASPSGSWSVLHDRWPPCHRSMIRVVSQRVSSGLPVIREQHDRQLLTYETPARSEQRKKKKIPGTSILDFAYLPCML